MGNQRNVIMVAYGEFNGGLSPGMPFPCGLPIVIRLLVWPPPDRAFHRNSFHRGLNQSENILTGEAHQDNFSSFAAFDLKMAYYVKIS